MPGQITFEFPRQQGEGDARVKQVTIDRLPGTQNCICIKGTAKDDENNHSARVLFAKVLAASTFDNEPPIDSNVMIYIPEDENDVDFTFPLVPEAPLDTCNLRAHIWALWRDDDASGNNRLFRTQATASSTTDCTSGSPSGSGSTGNGPGVVGYGGNLLVESKIAPSQYEVSEDIDKGGSRSGSEATPKLQLRFHPQSAAMGRALWKGTGTNGDDWALLVTKEPHGDQTFACLKMQRGSGDGAQKVQWVTGNWSTFGRNLLVLEPSEMTKDCAPYLVVNAL